MTSAAQRAASRTYHAKREAEGLRKVTVWLSSDARLILARKALRLGSRDRAVEDALRLLGDG